METDYLSGVKVTWCRKCGGTGEGPDSFTNEFTPACDHCHGAGTRPVKTKKI